MNYLFLINILGKIHLYGLIVAIIILSNLLIQKLEYIKNVSIHLAILEQDAELRNDKLIMINQNYSRLLLRLPLNIDLNKNGFNLKVIQSLADSISCFIDDLRDQVIDQVGNRNERLDQNDFNQIGEINLSKSYYDKYYFSNFIYHDSIGAKLQYKLIHLINLMFSEIDSVDKLSIFYSLPIPIYSNWNDHVYTKIWIKNNLQDLNVQEATLILANIKLSLQQTIWIFIDYLYKKYQSNTCWRMDQYNIYSIPESNFIYYGDTYTTELFVVNEDLIPNESNLVKLKINGEEYFRDIDGIVNYSYLTNEVGWKKYNVSVESYNPVTNELKILDKDFMYYVHQPIAMLEVKNRNTLYANLNNLIQFNYPIDHCHYPDVSIKDYNNQFSTNYLQDGIYSYKFSKPGKVDICVGCPEKQLSCHNFNIIPIPTPIINLDYQREDNRIQVSELIYLNCLKLEYREDFLEGLCEINEFICVRIRKGENELKLLNNSGLQLNEQVKELLNGSKEGDYLIFENFKGRCRGDVVSRNWNSVVIKVID